MIADKGAVDRGARRTRPRRPPWLPGAASGADARRRSACSSTASTPTPHNVCLVLHASAVSADLQVCRNRAISTSSSPGRLRARILPLNSPCSSFIAAFTEVSKVRVAFSRDGTLLRTCEKLQPCRLALAIRCSRAEPSGRSKASSRATDAGRSGLVRLHPPPAGVARTLLEPFDRVRPVDAKRSVRVVTRARARRLATTLLAEDRQWREPASAARMDVDLLAWQLVPAMALLAGTARRVLLADAVGLGKTVQAGIVARELLDRQPQGRVLVLAPAGLRLQWRDELSHRFGLVAEIADLAWIERLAQTLPPDVNPWSTSQVIIASLDFAKRTEVLPGPEHLLWDLVIVDEAHTLGAGPRAACSRKRSVGAQSGFFSSRPHRTTATTRASSACAGLDR